jgi:hypothetical protein
LELTKERQPLHQRPDPSSKDSELVNLVNPGYGGSPHPPYPAIGFSGTHLWPNPQQSGAQWIDNSSMADRDPILTVDKNDQRHFSQMAWINKGPTTSITAQVTP